MPFVDISSLIPFEKGSGWRARLFHTGAVTISHWEFDAGASVHPHHHSQEDVWEILEGAVEITVGDETGVARPGVVAVAPPDVVHSVKALVAGRAVVIDQPLRLGFGPEPEFHSCG